MSKYEREVTVSELGGFGFMILAMQSFVGYIILGVNDFLIGSVLMLIYSVAFLISAFGYINDGYCRKALEIGLGDNNE